MMSAILVGPTEMSMMSTRKSPEDHVFGALLRHLREDRGFARGQAFCDELLLSRSRQISERSLYSIEKGEREASYRELVDFVLVLKPDRGIHFFSPALDPEAAILFKKLNCAPLPDATPPARP